MTALITVTEFSHLVKHTADALLMGSILTFSISKKSKTHFNIGIKCYLHVVVQNKYMLNLFWIYSCHVNIQCLKMWKIPIGLSESLTRPRGQAGWDLACITWPFLLSFHNRQWLQCQIRGNLKGWGQWPPGLTLYAGAFSKIPTKAAVCMNKQKCLAWITLFLKEKKS